MRHKQQLIILGTRAFAEEVTDLVSDCDEYELAAFGENWERERCGRSLFGYPIIWVDELGLLAATHKAVCAIGTSQRSLFVKQAEDMGFQFATVRHPTAHIAKTSSVGVGSILSVGVIVAAHTKLGNHVIVNRGSLIGHHTAIGSYVTICPGANIAGRVSIGEGTYVGMGAMILDDIRVGTHSVVGAGAMVTKDVPDRVMVVGVPARVVKRDIDGK